mgnify:CR=1 FL=1
MKNPKPILTVIIASLTAILMTCSFSTVAASDIPTSDDAIEMISPDRIRIKIIIKIIIKKKGVFEVQDIRRAKEGQKVGPNQILADAYTENGKLFIRPVASTKQKGFIIFPKGFNIGMPPSLKEGEKGSFRIKGGEYKLQPQSLLQFEIQM